MAFLFPVLIATLATASPLSSLATKHSIDTVPSGWERQAAAPADHSLQLHIRLSEQNMDRLQERLLEVSDPEHPDYGKHLSKEELDALTAPTTAAVDSVSKWLASNGIDVGKPQSGYLQVTLTVDQAKKMLDADYAIYQQASTGQQTVRTTSYSLPKEVFNAVSMIQPTTMFSDLGASSKRFSMIYAKEAAAAATKKQVAKASIVNGKADACTNGFDTNCLRQNYNIKGYTASNLTTLGIAGFLEEVPSQEDLGRYIDAYQPSVPHDTKIPIVTINNGSDVAHGDGEADLDVQIAVPLTYPLNNVYYSTGGRPPINGVGKNTNEPYLEWLQYLAGPSSLPRPLASPMVTTRPPCPMNTPTACAVSS